MNAGIINHIDPKPVLDIFGKPITIGNKIVMAFKYGNSAELRKGKIVDIHLVWKFSGTYVDYVEIEWEGNWVKKSKIRKYFSERVMIID